MTGLKMVSPAALLCLLCLLPLLAAPALGSGELDILFAPSSIKFSGHEHLRESLVKEVFSAALGFSVQHSSEWSGLSITDPFDSPEAAVIVNIDGLTSLGPKAHLKGRKYSLITDESDWNTWKSLESRIKQRTPEGGNQIVNINLSEGPDAVNEYKSVFGEFKNVKAGKITLESLKPKFNDEDMQFVQELELLKAFTQRISDGAVSADNIVDLYWLEFKSLHALVDFHGADSPAVKEAKALLGDALNQLSDAFKAAYNNNIIVGVISSDSSHTRRARSLLQAEVPPANLENLNLADTYTPDYPIIFNIILWFSIILIFTLIAVTYVIADMDPGRDSIIYRMTSNRMKKEN